MPSATKFCYDPSNTWTRPFFYDQSTKKPHQERLCKLRIEVESKKTGSQNFARSMRSQNTSLCTMMRYLRFFYTRGLRQMGINPVDESSLCPSLANVCNSSNFTSLGFFTIQVGYNALPFIKILHHYQGDYVQEMWGISMCGILFCKMSNEAIIRSYFRPNRVQLLTFRRRVHREFQTCLPTNSNNISLFDNFMIVIDLAEFNTLIPDIAGVEVEAVPEVEECPRVGD